MADKGNPAVPNLVGMTQSDAEAALNDIGLTFTEEKSESDSTAVASGRVISTSPPAGAYVSGGSPVSMVISTGPAEVAVPDVAGASTSDARAKVEAAGLIVGAETQASSATLPKGQVSGTTPSAGTRVKAGSAVGIQVSSGPDTTSGNTTSTAPGSPDNAATVPHIVGLTQPAAEALLHTAGLTVGSTTSGASVTVPSGGIASVSPPAGTVLKSGSTVDIRLSTGPKTSNAVVYGGFALGLLALGIIVALISTREGGFLKSLADKDTARGLITFLIAFTAVVIAVILSVSTMVAPDGGQNDKRFDNGKQVLTLLIGVLGTIVGFYFGASDGKGNAISIATKSLPKATSKKDYPPVTLVTVGGTTPFKWSVSPELPTGMKLDSVHGVIDGAAAASQPMKAYTFTVSDSATPSTSNQATLELEVVDPK